jgi:Spy/CpxP family protein refolding chaperone
MKGIKMKSILISLFICAFSFGLVNAQPFREEGKMKHKNMMEKLNLSDEQKEKIQALRLNHRKEMIDLKADLEKAELALNELKTKKNFSRNDYLSAVEKINTAENKISLSRANHRMDVYELLTDKQKEEFWEFEPGFRMKHDGHGLMHQMRDRD